MTDIFKSAAVVALVLGWRAAAGAEAQPQGGELLRVNCGGCHAEHAGQFERISAIRKSPEGWVMTLARMRQVHGLTLDEATRDAIVRYLADAQGLAPSESAAGRFALERRPNAQDLDLGAEIGVMCGRCHSLARASLQRRDEEEWRKLAHTHLGQWPSLEYQASGRDRPWWQLASVTLPPKLAQLYPFASPAWTQWKAHAAPELGGTWAVAGHVPGGKDFFGSARIERAAGGDWQAHYQLTDAAGFEFAGQSKAILYTGYEWRGTAALGDRAVHEVYAVSADGNRITGRWFEEDHAEEGGEWTAVRDGSTPEVLAVIPASLRAGSIATVTLVSNGLEATRSVAAGTAGRGTRKSAGGAGGLSFGEGISVLSVQRGAHFVRAQVQVASTAVPGWRQVSAGGAGAVGTAGRVAVYAQIDKVEVVPGYAIARLGGGRVDPVTAQFEAMASTRLPSGEWLALGPVTARWSALPYDAEAKRTEDEKFAGHFDERGRYLPSAAGPNPAREFSGDNVGNLKVVAQVNEGSSVVEGNSHLIVTVQRWITPPIY